MRRVTPFTLLSLAFLLAVPAGGQQVPSAAIPEAQMRIPARPTLFDDWARLYYGHEWGRLQASVQQTLAVIPSLTPELQAAAAGGAAAPVPPIHTFDFKNNYYRIAFFSKFAKSDGEEIQFLVHEGGLEPYANRLPGVEEFFDVFLDLQGDAVARSSYVSSRVANPLTEKLASFVKQIDLTGLAKLVGARPEAVDPNASAFLFIHVRRVELPFQRASIAVVDELAVPQALDKAQLRKDSATLAQSSVLRTAAGSPCATLLANCLDLALRSETDVTGPALDRSACQGHFQWPTGPSPAVIARARAAERDDCAGKTASESGILRCMIDKRLRKTYDSVLTSSPECSAAAVTDFQAAVKVEEGFKGLIAAAPVKIKKEVTYENVPLERVSLGGIVSVIGSISGDQRVKLDSAANLVANPISGTLTMAVVNIHPTRFDPKTADPTPAERFRFFTGVCMTPEFGLGVGAGYSLFRGLSINAGYAWLRVDSLRKGDQLTIPASPPSRPKDPFKNGVAEAFFVGFGYNF